MCNSYKPGELSNNTKELVKRSLLPEILLIEDLAGAFGITPKTVRRLLKKGEFGPFAKIGRRYVLLRESLMVTIGYKLNLPEDAQVSGNPSNLLILKQLFKDPPECEKT